MSGSENYSAWFCQELKKMVDLIANQTYITNPQALNNQIMEIQRGVEYGTNNPGSIDDLLFKIGRNLVDSIQVYLRQMKSRSPAGVPPGGQATILSGAGVEQPSDFETSDQQFSVDELKGALATRKKEKVESKMKGSLDLLKEYDES